MKEWFLNLEPRERVILAIGALIAAAIIAYGGIWRPLTSATADLRRSVEQKERLLVDLQRAASVAVETVAPSRGGETSLVVLVDSSRRAHGLSEPNTANQGTNAIRVTFQTEEWDALARWLVGLETEHGVTVESSDVSVRQPGLVYAVVTLSRY